MNSAFCTTSAVRGSVALQLPTDSYSDLRKAPSSSDTLQVLFYSSDNILSIFSGVTEFLVHALAVCGFRVRKQGSSIRSDEAWQEKSK
jgi:hypothetical protein